MALHSSSYEFTYDVFLSFRGFDTRYGFTGNLCNALRDKGIKTFMDDKELRGGEEITPALSKAIEDSRISIIVFSKNYAKSSFCLDELVHILLFLDSSKPEEDRVVLPVFYDVEPFHLRHQTSSYGGAMVEHEERLKNSTHGMERLQKWKMALNQAANLSGYTFKTAGKEYEYKFIGEIVDFVSNKINRTPLHAAGYCVGLESRILQVISLLNLGFDDGVCMVGIHGIGGIGKTTLAREIYNSIANQFKVLCFLDNVRQKSLQHGLVHLQETLLFETVGEKHIKLGSVSKGSSMIKKRLNTMKVLLILDDVDELNQLKLLAGGCDWFGPGSRVIITTRDKQLLSSHMIERTYEVEELSEEDALKLLVQKAFKDNKFDLSYKDVLNRAVTYASGLPLALEVVGSNLSGENRPEEWESLLDQYERIPNKEIQMTIQVSFKAMEEEYKSVFLDIACCFKGYDLAEVECILCAHHGHCIKNHIRVLVAKSLIKITQNNIVTLHDLIEDMGKEIVRQESPNNPEKRRRLWFHKDIVPVLKENTGTRKIELIYLDCHSFDVVVNWNGEAFKKMRNIKTLIIKGGYFSDCHFSTGPKHFPSSLRVLEWERYPSQFIPSIFSNKVFVNMIVLKFEKCEYLTDIPNVFSLPNLEIFSFANCTNLITIHESLGFLSKLKVLNVWGCTKLKSFPPIIKLPSLQELNLSRCESLERFPEISGEMKNVTKLSLKETSIKVLPSSFQNLTGLCNLDIEGCRPEGRGLRLPISVLMMSNLTKIIAYDCKILNDNIGSIVSSNVKVLHITYCRLEDEILLKVLKLFVNVEELNLEGNCFTTLPECIKECRFLRKLTICDCWDIDQEIQGLPPNLKYLDARFCDRSMTSSLLMNQKLHEDGGTEFIFPSVTESIPQWFEKQSKGMSIPLWFRNSIPSIVLFLRIISKSGFDSIFLHPYIRIRGNKFPISPIEKFDACRLLLRHTYVYDVRLQDRGPLSRLLQALSKNEWHHAEIVFEDIDHPIKKERERPWFLIESGILVLKQSMKDVRFTDPYKGKRKLDDVMCPTIDEEDYEETLSL